MTHKCRIACENQKEHGDDHQRSGLERDHRHIHQRCPGICVRRCCLERRKPIRDWVLQR
jgi:hypothetical protein